MITQTRPPPNEEVGAQSIRTIIKFTKFVYANSNNEDGFRFFFYSNENNEPPHVHVEKADGTAKIWLSPVKIEYMIGLTPRQQKVILAL